MPFSLELRLVPAGEHIAVIDEVCINFAKIVWLTIVYRIQHEGEEFRIREMLALEAPTASADYQRTAEGKGRVKQILDAHNVLPSEIKDFVDIPELLRGKAVRIVVSHKEESGLKVPRVSSVVGKAALFPEEDRND
jgi:hypothetical protein